MLSHTAKRFAVNCGIVANTKQTFTTSSTRLSKTLKTTSQKSPSLPVASSFTSIRPHPSSTIKSTATATNRSKAATTTSKQAFTTTTTITTHSNSFQSSTHSQHKQQTRQFTSILNKAKNVQNFVTKNEPSMNTKSSLLEQQQLLKTLMMTPTSVNQSSFVITALVGALFGVASVYITGYGNTKGHLGKNFGYENRYGSDDHASLRSISSTNGNKQITFADIEQLLSEPEVQSFEADVVGDGREHKLKFKEYNIDDYRLVMSLSDDDMPVREKINALRSMLLKHIQQTLPLYNLLEDKIDYVNAAILDRLYIQYVMQAKLLHQVLGRPLDQNDIKHKVQRDSMTQIMNPEQLSQLRAHLIMLNDKVQHDYPTYEQSDYLQETELRQVYNELQQLCLDSAMRLSYYKFLVLFHDMENAIPDNDKELFARLDTTVTNAHNRHANAFTDALDALPQIGLRQRILLYKTKTMEVVANILSNLEFFIDAIPAVNDNIYSNLKGDIYRLARQQQIQTLQDENPEVRLDEIDIDSLLDIPKIENTIQQAFDESKLSYSNFATLHTTFYTQWLQLAICDEKRVGLLKEDELGQVYRSLRQRYLDSKSQEFIPLFFLQEYDLDKPMQYNELYNRAYNLLGSDEALQSPDTAQLLNDENYRLQLQQLKELSEPVAKYYAQFYTEQDQYENDINQAGL